MTDREGDELQQVKFRTHWELGPRTMLNFLAQRKGVLLTF